MRRVDCALAIMPNLAISVPANIDFDVNPLKSQRANNIGIDAIGWEGTAPTNDQARNGVIRGNSVYNISSYGNPAYRNQYAAAGIYVDGGRDIIIEQNIVHHVDYGIELASEHQGRATSSVTVRNNFISYSNAAGIGIGGYAANKGSAESCVIVNNTLFSNDVQTDYFGELYVQYNVRNNIIKNNIFVADSDNMLIRDEHKNQDNSGNNLLDNNLYYVLGGASSGSWAWMGKVYNNLRRVFHK